MRALVTRPRADAEALAAKLASLGHDAVLAPVFDIILAPSPELPLDGAQALLFTSANGVRAFIRASERRDLPVFAVGAATAATARELGFASVDSADGDVADLARLVAARLKPDGGHVLHVAGSEVAGDLAAALAASGFDASRAVLYRAEPRAALSEECLAALRAGKIDAALFFSPRTAAAFVRLAREGGVENALARVVAIGLSPAVVAALGDSIWSARLAAARPDEAALLDALADHAAGSVGDGMTDATPKDSTPGDSMPAAPPPGERRTSASNSSAADATRQRSPLTAIAIGVAVFAVAWMAWREFNPPFPPQPPDLGPLTQRLAELEKRLAAANAAAGASVDMAAKLAAVSDRLATLENKPAPPPASTAALSQIDPGLRDRVDKLEATLGNRSASEAMQIASLTAENRRLSSELARLQESVATLSTTLNERLAVRRGESVILAVGQLRETAGRGAAFAPELSTLRGLAGDEPGVIAAMATLEPMAAKGVATRATLRLRFEAVALEATRNVQPASGESWWERGLARLSGLIAIRPVGEVEGDGVLARVARAEARLGADDLAGAVAALEGDARTRDLAASWLAEARARLALEDALARLAAHALARGG
ncbi:MAG TPA: uroporphyrinogen-III synthase [Alphaproteobacteria bacterium]|nr:uroporphyrinogen-III synthase [Alphaproteobacteria bacterium]